MSDLYLVLRSRLEAVPEWVFIDTAVLKEAREARGLSYESAARELHISSKTWERYEKAGRVPRPLVPRVADVLGLEIEQPAPRRVRIEPEEIRVAALDELRDHLDARLDKIEATLGIIAAASGIDLQELVRAAAAIAAEAEERATELSREGQPQQARAT